MIYLFHFIYINKKSEDFLYIYFMFSKSFYFQMYEWRTILVHSQAFFIEYHHNYLCSLIEHTHT